MIYERLFAIRRCAVNQVRADWITTFYGQGTVHQAAQHLPYYTSLLPALVIHEVRPAQTRPDALYVTNGLSVPVHESPVGYGFELQMIAPGGKAWPVALLTSLAGHTLRTGNRFGPGQSIALTSALTGMDDTLKALIFAHAPGLPSRLSLPEGEVHIVTVVGVTADEYEWARRYSAHELVALLQLCGQGVATLPRRHSIVPGVPRLAGFSTSAVRTRNLA
jgi:hypothetical protein